MTCGNFERVYCKECDGTGYTVNRGEQIATGIFSLGMWPIMDALTSSSRKDSLLTSVCKLCDGNGYQLRAWR